MLRSAALAALAFLPFVPTAPFQDPPPAKAGTIEDRRLEPIAQRLAAYFAARATATQVDAARAALESSLAELAKELGGRDLLSRPADLERLVRLARGESERGPKAGKVSEDTCAPGGFRGSTMRYAFRLPSDYDPRAETTYPLLLAIPDAGEKPAAHLRESWSSRELRDGAIVVVPEMPEDEAEWDRVIVRGKPGGLCHVLTALRVACERFAVDFDRVFVAGYGKGVPAAIGAGNYAPQRFAGVIGRAGDAGELGPENFGHLPTLFAGGGARARAFLERAHESGYENSKVEPLAKEEDVWAWMQKHPRETRPDRVTVVVGNPFPTRCYWLRLASTATDTRATARIERDSNTVRIEGHGASHATLFLNDQLLDLDRPVHFVCNGAEVELHVQRRLATTLDLLEDGTSDPACVYVAQVTLSMSDPASAAYGELASRADPDFRQRLDRAGEDVELLWDLYEWCGATERPAKARVALRRLLRVQPDHEPARAALGYVRAGSRWFTSQEAMDRFLVLQDPVRAPAMGWVELDGTWIHPDERALAAKQLEKDWESGQWLALADRRRLEKGWLRQDLAWIAPEEAERVDEGEWFAGGEWLELPAANRRHARIESMWRIPTTDVLLETTIDREVALGAIHATSRAVPELVRAFGVAPQLPLRVVILRDEEQYDRFAFGDPDGRRPATQAGRLQVIHSAYFAESRFERVEGALEHRACGVCYWDSLAPNGDLYGVHAARLAYGLSWADAIDPSPKTVRKALANGPGADFYASYQAEKQLPMWFRYGGAVYAERYFEDREVAQGGDPWWTRKWSLDNLEKRGGLQPLAEIFAFQLDPDDRDAGLKLFIEAGLLVAFALDGDCAPVRAAHEDLKKALAAGRLRPSHVEAFTRALADHEAELRAFAGL